MSQVSSHSQRFQVFLLHVVAGGLALIYAWAISGTGYVTTGVQFVAPLAIIIAGADPSR